MINECISAISTARGVGGVAIIRISGDNALKIAEKMFKCKTDVCDFEPYRMYVGRISAGEFSDFGMCVYFKAPKSYTGEDMVEFHCHGGIAISEGILKQTFNFGSRPATNGEFTKRAFLNGKMSLSSAEGLIDMINGETVAEAKCGFYLYREKLLNNIIEKQNTLTNVLAQIDVDIDYPEEDVPSADEKIVKNRLTEIRDGLVSLIDTFKNASKVKSGIKVALCGKPNAGKSSLLNSLLGCDKAIVSSVSGTTRDIVEGYSEINGIKFVFFDTAGIHDSVDEVEKIGIQRSYKAIEGSDIAVMLCDAEAGIDDEDFAIIEKIKPFNHVVILNKSDVCDNFQLNFDLKISVKNGEGLEQLKKLVFEKSNAEKVNLNGDYITEERHYYALKDALDSIDSAISNIGIFPLDIVTVDLRNAWQSLGKISGLTCDQAVIDEIFAKFCVGK